MRCITILLGCCAVGLASTLDFHAGLLHQRSEVLLSRHDGPSDHYPPLVRRGHAQGAGPTLQTDRNGNKRKASQPISKEGPRPPAPLLDPFKAQMPPECKAGFVGNTICAGWTKSTGQRYHFGFDQPTGRAGSHVHPYKVSAGIAKHERGQPGGMAYAEGQRTKLVMDMEPGSRAKVTTTQPGGEPQIQHFDADPNQRVKQRTQYRSGVPGQHMRVEAEWEQGAGEIKAKASNGNFHPRRFGI